MRHFRFATVIPLAVLLLALCAQASIDHSRVTLTGNFSPTTPQLDRNYASALLKETPLWDSWQGDNANTGRFSYGPFTAGKNLELLITGFPGAPGISLDLVLAETGKSIALRPTSPPATYWTRAHWNVPAEWVGRECLLVAEDASKENGGWIGVSAPLLSSSQIGRAFVETLLQLAVYALLLVPGFAAMLFFANASHGRALALLLIGSALSAYTVFLCYYWHPEMGRIAVFAIFTGSAVSIVAHWRTAVTRLRQTEFAAPLFLGAAVAGLYFAGCFLFGGIESPEGVAISRFWPGLPTDCLIPHWFAKTLAQGSPLRPFVADWLTSDRPPLQAGLNLLVWPFIPVRHGYPTVGIAAQSWVWIGLWVCLRQLGVSLRGIAWVMAGSIFAGFFFLNSAFCWPKLLPAAFLLLATGLVWEKTKDQVPDTSATFLIAASLAFAMLGHGGSFFGVAGIALAFLFERRKLNLRFLATGAVTGLLLMTPWLLYQKFADPPGDRLIKYHLAGREAIDLRPSLVVIKEAYGELTWKEFAANKVANCQMFVGKQSALSELYKYFHEWRSGTANTDSLNRLRHLLRELQFFHYFNALGPLVVGFVGLLLAWRSKIWIHERKAAYLAIRLALFSIIVWYLMMFKGGSTCNHSGTYYMGACLYVCTALGLLFLPKLISLATMGLSIGWFFWVWMTAPVVGEANALPPSAFAGFQLLVAGFSALIGCTLVWLWRKKDPGETGATPQPPKNGAPGIPLEGLIRFVRERKAAFLFVLVLTGAVIVFLRKPDSFLNPQFWAEDGMVFFSGAYEQGLAPFFTPYGGYLLAVPRLIAWLALFFDPLWTPTIYNYVSFGFHLAIFSAVFSPRITLPAKPLLAFFIVCAPHTGEVFASLSNVQWILAFALILLLLADDPSSWKQWAFDGAALFFCGMTGPFLVFFSPLFVARAVTRKTRASWLLLAAVLLIVVIQTSFLFIHQAEFVRHTPVDIPMLLSALGARHFGSFWAGYGIPAVGVSPAWIVFGLLTLALLIWIVFQPGPWRNLRIALGAAWGCCSLPVAIKFVREAWSLAGAEHGDRYFFLPHLFLGWILIVYAIENPGWKRLVTVPLLLTALMANLPYMQSPPLVDYRWAEHVQPIRDGKPFSIPINPPGFGIASEGKAHK